MNNKFWIWLWPVLWMILIFALSHQPGGTSSGLSSGLAYRLFEVVSSILPVEFETIHTLLRKNAHFFAYFILGILLVRALRKSGAAYVRAMFWALAGSALYAATDEVHQLFIPGRSGELRDVLIDTAGAATGLLVYAIATRIQWGRHKHHSAKTV